MLKILNVAYIVVKHFLGRRNTISSVTIRVPVLTITKIEILYKSFVKNAVNHFLHKVETEEHAITVKLKNLNSQKEFVTENTKMFVKLVVK